MHCLLVCTSFGVMPPGKLPPLADSTPPLTGDASGRPTKTPQSNGAYAQDDAASAGRLSSNTEAGPNPFALPADEEMFKHREEEKKRRQEARAVELNAPVCDKTTFASRMQATFIGGARDILQDFRAPKGAAAKKEATVAAASVSQERRKDKENMSEFIAKKREIFLLQMSLDTKRAEIKKLEERARQRDEALKKSEAMLEEDALRFDAFLKENDEKVQEAIKKAEVEAKAKQDKVMEIKRLNTAIAALRSELNKFEEQLDDCRKYKEFLDNITPSEWFEQQAKKQQQRKEVRLQEWQVACEDVKKRKEAAAAAKQKAESDYANARTQQEAERAERAIKDATANLKEAIKEKEPLPPKLDDTVDAEEEEMFFVEPAQLLAVYAALEESNLFLIQNAQETEEALEELRAKYRDTKSRMDNEVDGLAVQIASLEAAIGAARDKAQRLRDRTIEDMGSLTLTSMVGSNEITLTRLSQKVQEVYVRCGFDFDASISTLQMLTNIEAKLEEHLTLVDTMPPDFVEVMEKSREKERRRIARDEKMAHQKAEHESRVKRALERAAAPVFKRTGKPVMHRSQPIKKKIQVKEDNANNDEAELEAYLARDML